MPDLILTPDRLLRRLKVLPDAPRLPGAAVYQSRGVGDGMEFVFEPGALASRKWLAADFLLDGTSPGLFVLRLREGARGPVTEIQFGFLNQCQARVRIPLSATDQNAWMLSREGAWLKPLVGGQRIDLARVDRIILHIARAPGPIRFEMTRLSATVDEPPRLDDPLLPAGALIDELGQWKLRDWPGRTASVDQLKARLQKQLAEAPGCAWPRNYSRFGGCGPRRLDDGSGFFRTTHDGRRWWLVDPEGYLFWSAGLDCVRSSIESSAAGLEKAFDTLPPDHGRLVNFLGLNFQRVFDDRWKGAWSTIALAQIRAAGFNTVANWSEWSIASAAKFPYVRPLNITALLRSRVYRDFPDVFDPAFRLHAREYAQQLRETADDPAMIGYFLMNEPTWGFSRELPAVGMLYTTETCHCRRALAHQLRVKYGDDATLVRAWGIKTSLDAIQSGRWTHTPTQAAMADLTAFSTIMVEHLFHVISEACRRVDPHHLNLGARYHTVPPEWALRGMTPFDVFSINCYQNKVPAQPLERIEAAVHRPVLIGEWHFGALDVGLPASGIGRVKDQADRGRAFRCYVEDAATIPQCVGVHYFTMYDQSAIGREDGENYNIGLWDVCNRPYEPLTAAARATHERLYAVRQGKLKPFADAPNYLPRIFY